MVQLYLDKESKTDEALSTFQEIKNCIYGSKLLGSSGQEEAITCDCQKHFANGINVACDEYSDCINRSTSVECVNNACFDCGPDCQNQRFQKKQYAKISIFDAGKKGYGVRVDEDLTAGTFIYEYIGDVINESTFRARMLDYDAEGVVHFYFMMLQKNEFIDATKKGSLARFCNHSCNPNAYVDKWVVGSKLRMGIFAKRDISRGEEISFDYNVDRYGAVAQPCYCGEDNCVGELGGKTQTDSARLLPQTLAEALRIDGSEEKEWIKLQKKKNKKFKVKNNGSNVNEEFISHMEIKPLVSKEVPKVMSALMLPNQEPIIIEKLIERIYISDEEEDISRLLIKMHGYKTFSTILKELWKVQKDQTVDTVIKMIEILLRWPAQSKNKITSSLIEVVLKNIYQDSEQYSMDKLNSDVSTAKYDELSERVSELLSVWNSLQMAYRIRKRNDDEIQKSLLSRKKEEEEEELIHETTEKKPINKYNGYNNGYNNNTNNNNVGNNNNDDSGYNNNGYNKNYNGNNNGFKRYITGYSKPENVFEAERRRLEEAKLGTTDKRRPPPPIPEPKTDAYLKIIEDAKKADEKRRKEEKLAKEQRKLIKEISEDSQTKKELSLEVCLKLWMKAFAVVVPNIIKDHWGKIGKEKIKLCAKDIVKILSEKEVKRHGLKYQPPKNLTDDRIKKVKEFVKQYMKKWMLKYQEKKEVRAPSLSLIDDDNSNNSNKKPNKRRLTYDFTDESTGTSTKKMNV